MFHKPLPGFGLPGTIPTGLHPCEFALVICGPLVLQGTEREGLCCKAPLFALPLVIFAAPYEYHSHIFTEETKAQKRVSDMPKITQLEMTELRLGFSFV